jgi:hypothetical protein
LTQIGGLRVAEGLQPGANPCTKLGRSGFRGYGNHRRQLRVHARSDRDDRRFRGKDLINVDIGNMPNGTFAVGYGEDASGTPYVNPFTEAGLIDTPPVTAPEPASLLLLGTSLLGARVLSRRRQQA